MNEFEWQRRLRSLVNPREPARDLWPQIAARIANETVTLRSPHRKWQGWAIAAGVVLGLTVLIASQMRLQSNDFANTAAHRQAQSPSDATAARYLPRTALDWNDPRDPQLAAAASEIDSATFKLQEALEQRPDAVFLVSLLNRSYGRRMRLARIDT